MDFNDYQQRATKTATISEEERGMEYVLMYFCLGLAGETGEVIEKIKKVIRNDDGVVSDEKRKEIKYELGDVLWYLSQIARMCDIQFENVAQANIEKLTDRALRGVIRSEGDTR